MMPSVWIHNQLGLDDTKINMKRLHLNMVVYFEDALLSRYKDVNLLKLSASKLIEAKQIPIGELTEIQEAYENPKLKSDVVFNDNVPSVQVNRKNFEQWTKTEKQTKRVILGNQLIKSIDDVEKGLSIKIYPINITQATNNFILFDYTTNTYQLNREMIFL